MTNSTRMEAQQGLCGLGGDYMIFVDGAPTPEDVAAALFWLTLFVWLIFWPMFLFEWLWTRMRRGVRSLLGNLGRRSQAPTDATAAVNYPPDEMPAT